VRPSDFSASTGQWSPARRTPQQRERVQVKVPVVTGDEQAWAPMLRQIRDSSFAPEPGDEVLVAFEAGDPASPVVLGMLWSSSARPPIAKGS
jgi:Type VI secretion system/phage-baseplate injector OB domain